MIKKEIRVLGISCGSSCSRYKGPMQVVGVVYRGNRWLEGAMRTTIPPAGVDPVPRIAKMVKSSPHFPQLRVIAMDQLVTKSGNYVNIQTLSRKTGLPVVVALRKGLLLKRPSKVSARPAKSAITALEKLQCRKWRLGRKTFFVYSAGLGGLDLDELMQVCASRDGIPEAARVARIAAASLEKFLTKRAPRANISGSKRHASL